MKVKFIFDVSYATSENPLKYYTTKVVATSYSEAKRNLIDYLRVIGIQIIGEPTLSVSSITY